MKKLIKTSVLLLLSGAVVLMSSCSKQDDSNGGSPIVKGSAKDKRIRELMSKLPVEKLVYERTAGKGGDVTLDAWNFSNPSQGGTAFSSGTANSSTASSGPTTIYISSSSFGGNTGGGTVVAGSTTLNINYTFCFSSEDDAFGLGLFDGLSFTGVSSVIGVSGDFEALADATDSTEFSDIFHGLAFYIVYDGSAQGTYDIIDWTDGIDDSTATDGNAFAFVFDFVNGRLFMSQDGSIIVSGGSMNFSGQYLQVEGFINEDGDFDLDGDLTYSIVSGVGAMGCN